MGLVIFVFMAYGDTSPRTPPPPLHLECLCVAEQAGLSRTWSQAPKTYFVITWLEFFLTYTVFINLHCLACFHVRSEFNSKLLTPVNHPLTISLDLVNVNKKTRCVDILYCFGQSVSHFTCQYLNLTRSDRL